MVAASHAGGNVTAADASGLGTLLRVVAADDHPVVRAGLTAILAVEPDLELVAAVGTAAEAIDAVARTRPDVVIMDLRLPDLDGVTATTRILHLAPATAVLVLSMRDEDEALFEAVRAGARGYLVKGATHVCIAEAIRAVGRGDVLFSAEIAGRLLESLAGRRPPPLPELTDREREVLDLLAAGLGTHQVAGQLFLSPKTVRNYVSRIMTRLGAVDRAQAIALARRAGLGSRAGVAEHRGTAPPQAR